MTRVWLRLPKTSWFEVLSRLGAVVLAAAMLLPLTASGLISTGPTGDRAWLWQNPLTQGNDLRSTAWINASTGWAVGVTGTALKTTDGGATWVAQDPGTVRDLTGVSFVDANNGWICGVSATVLRTTDGGTTWVAQTAPTTPAARNLRSISFFNSSVGVAVGDQGTTTSTIVYTSNGGTTWRQAVTPSTVGLSSVQMVSATTGWAVGGSGVILKTTDGGATWASVASPTVAGLSAVSFAPGGTVGYVVGNAVLPDWTIYKTTNSGASWSAVTGLGVTGAINLTGVSCLDANNAVAVGTNGQVRRTTNAGTTWSNQSLNNLGGQALRDVKMLDANNVKAIGDFGQTFYTRNGGNAWFTPTLGTGATYLSTFFVDPNHGWVVGGNGTIMRTADAGQTWETQSSGITWWRGVHFTSLTNGWVVGDGGQILHTTDGINWSPQASTVPQQLNGVWFTSATTGFAVGANGTILKTTNSGTTWNAQSSGTASTLNAVWFANANTGWVVGAGGLIRRTTNGGASWTAQTSGTGQNLLCIRGVTTSRVWAAGNGGTMVATINGTSWSTLAPGAGTNPIRTVFFSSNTEGWFASNYGIVRRTTDGGATWVSQNAGMPTNTLDPATGIYGCWFTSTTPYTGYLVGDSGTIRRTADGGTTWVSQQFGTLSTLNCAGFADASRGWIGGTGGTMMNTVDGGQSWSLQKTGSNSAFNGMSVVNTQTVWAAGDNGSIRKTTDGGLTWAGQTSGVTVNLRDLSAPDTTHAVIVGAGGVAKYTADAGSTWTTGSIDTTQQISSVWMVDASSGWAVGGRIAGFNSVYHTVNGGATWTPQATTANANLWDVYFRTPLIGYATGDSGVILRTVDGGANWVRCSTPTTLPFYSITFSDANGGTACGGGGLIARTSDGGATWALQSSGSARSLNAATMLDATHAFIAGSGGTILRLGDFTPPFTTLSVTPASSDGGGGWYKTAPLCTLSSSKPGVTNYGWTSLGGPFSVYSAPVTVPEGPQSLYYYSVDTSGNIEAAREATFSVDFTPPVATAEVTVTAIATDTASVQWLDSSDALSGVDHYLVSVSPGTSFSVPGTSTPLLGLTPGTLYSVGVRAVDVAGNVSSASTVSFTTQGIDYSPMSTLLTVIPAAPDGTNGWYVTTPTVTMASLPMGVPANIWFNWTGANSTYSSYTATISPPAGTSTLFYSSHDQAVPGHAAETTRQAPFSVDTEKPVAPSVVASATSYSSVDLTWAAVTPTPSGIARYDLYRDGGYFASTTETTFGVLSLSPSTHYAFDVYAVNSAGTSSTAGSASITTSIAPLPLPPTAVLARAPQGDRAYLNWLPSDDAFGTIRYRVWRSNDGAVYSAVGTTTAGLYNCTYIDRGLGSSTRYWYAVSTVDDRGESSLSSTASANWYATAPTTLRADRILGLNATGLDKTVYLEWLGTTNPSVVGYVVLRGSSSLSTMTTVTTVPATSTAYFDLGVLNGEKYYYQVAAVDASGVVGSPSVEAEANPLAPLPVNQPQPHEFGNESACICHATHNSSTMEPLVRFPLAEKNTICRSCHAPLSSLTEFTDPLAKSKHPMGAVESTSQPYGCVTCHVPLVRAGSSLDNLMRVNSSSPCVVVTSTPAGNGFCYSCHGSLSLLPTRDMTVFESSGHRNVPAPATGANITCDACHSSHSSRNTGLLRYEGFMVCVQCHTASASDPNQVDILGRLMLNEGANSKHPLLPQDQTTGARMTCQNCHNTHTTTKTYPLVEPHNPGPTGTWTAARSDEKTFCFRCHNGLSLPTSLETTPWAAPVLARGALTTTTDIQSRYTVNVHGFASASGDTTTTAHLRTDMGYGYGDVLECRACHDPHGTANANAVQDTVVSANGSKAITGVLTARVPTGGRDFRFFCNTCHLWDSASHDSRAGTSTVDFPMNCKACHGHSVTAVPGVVF